MIRLRLSLMCAAVLIGSCSSEPESKNGAWIGELKLCAETVRGFGEGFDHGSQETTLQIRMTQQGAEQLRKMSLDYVGKPLPIVVNGQPISIPTLVEPLEGEKFEISGAQPGQLADVVNYAQQPC